MVSIWPFGLLCYRTVVILLSHENQCKMWFRINSLIIRLPVEKPFRLCQKQENSRRITRKRRCVSRPCSDGDDHLTFERRMGQFQTDLKRKQNFCLDSLVLCLSRKIQLRCKGLIIRASWPVLYDSLALPKVSHINKTQHKSVMWLLDTKLANLADFLYRDGVITEVRVRPNQIE